MPLRYAFDMLFAFSDARGFRAAAYLLPLSARYFDITPPMLLLRHFFFFACHYAMLDAPLRQDAAI